MKESKLKHDLILRLVDICYKPEIYFENENLQDRELKEPCVIICNHTNVQDGPVLRYLFNDKDVCSLMAKDMMEKLHWKYIVSNAACIPVDRNNASTAWLHDCVSAIKEGNSVIIFPEGTTANPNDIDEFKSGFLLLAKTANVKVLPIAINGKYDLFSRGELKLKIGVPTDLNIARMNKASLEKEAERFQKIVADMYAQITDENENYFNEKLEKECY